MLLDQRPQFGKVIDIQAVGIRTGRLDTKIPRIGGSHEQLTLGLDFIISRRISAKARTLYE
jgi:hypothetical protein